MKSKLYTVSSEIQKSAKDIPKSLSLCSFRRSLYFRFHHCTATEM